MHLLLNEANDLLLVREEAVSHGKVEGVGQAVIASANDAFKEVDLVEQLRGVVLL